MNNSFAILEFKSIYYKNNSDVFEKDLDGNLVVSKKVFNELECFILKNSEQSQFLKPTYKKNLGKVLQAQNYVGVIQAKDGTTIEILPKIQNIEVDESKEILIKMLKTLKKSPFKNFNMANLKSFEMPLLEIFIFIFLKELSMLIKKGTRFDYIIKDENLKFLKGKLKISQQIKYNTIHKERFFVQHQEFCSNKVENRLIKTTLNYLYKKSKSNKNQQRIREFLFVFDEIELSYDFKADFKKIKPNRLMKSYEQVLIWCKTFLLENSFSPYKGNDVAFALLFDMNLLFESYVGYYLKQKNLNIRSQDKSKHLVEKPEKFALKPDFVIDYEDFQLIADTKWKILNEEKDILQSDMYQLYAYGTKYEKCKIMYLIYPYQIQESLKRIRYLYHEKESDNLVLNVLFFDVIKNKFFEFPNPENDKKFKLYELIEEFH